MKSRTTSDKQVLALRHSQKRALRRDYRIALDVYFDPAADPRHIEHINRAR